MHRGNKLLASLFMSAALAAPIAVNAAARPQDDRDHERQERERRVYDREHRDYHRKPVEVRDDAPLLCTRQGADEREFFAHESPRDVRIHGHVDS